MADGRGDASLVTLARGRDRRASSVLRGRRRMVSSYFCLWER